MRALRPERGFTLIELLIVVFIIGLLASVVTISVSTSRAQARDAKRKADLQLVATSLELYYAENRQYPDAFDSWDWSGLRTALVPDYSSSVPSDPVSSRIDGDYERGGYVYRSDSEQGKFVVDGTLERDDEIRTITGPFHATDPSNPNFFQSGTYATNSGETIHYRISGQ